MRCADATAVMVGARRAWKPPPRLSLSAWAERKFVLSTETAAEPGPWRTIPYQRGIMDAITDPAVTEVSVMKSARVGYTLMLSAAIGYYVEHEPSSILLAQPTVEDGKNFSKETIAPMFRDVPALREIRFRDIEEKGPKDSSNTLTHKVFPGGVLSIVGANSGTGFRRVSRRIILLDEADAFPPSAGNEGDPVRLATMRSQAFWNRKRVAGSTPLIAGSSRIEKLFEEGDQRRYFVPCPQCGHMAPLVFRVTDKNKGHSMTWPEGKPEEAFFTCERSGCVIEHHQKRQMVERGEWRAAKPFAGHASFHLWAAYSYSPNATWAHIAAEFLAAKDDPRALQTFVNTWLGETWRQVGEAPEWERLYERRETYAIGTVPAPVLLVTAGVDVQKDRLEWEAVGWGQDKQSWSVDVGVIWGDTAGPEPWAELDALLSKTWAREQGGQLGIAVMAVDSGYNTNTVYNWARRYSIRRVIAVKGSADERMILGAPRKVDQTVSGKRITRGYRYFPVGVDMAKSELYGWLRLKMKTTEGGEAAPFPPGWCHFPEHGEDFFKQLTAEHLVATVKASGFTEYSWALLPGRRNEGLDRRVYARAAAYHAGLDRLVTPPSPPPTPAAAGAPAPVAAPAAPPPAPAARPPPALPSRPRGSWLGAGSGGGWLRKR